MNAAEEKDDELEDKGIVESDGEAGKDEEHHTYGEDEVLRPDVGAEPVEHFAPLDGLLKISLLFQHQLFAEFTL